MDKKRIMVVDDDEAFTRIVRLTLEQTGRYDVRVMHAGQEVIPAVREFQPHLILLDVILPDMDGCELGTRIKADAALSGIPIVFLTGLATGPKNAPGGFVRHGFRFVGKVMSGQELVRCVEENLQTPAGDGDKPGSQPDNKL
ncbi:MAG: response regulator [Verrucomicrobiae bacterium]|nr:response regulator [Verrucomicrobiae bacterium]